MKKGELSDKRRQRTRKEALKTWVKRNRRRMRRIE